MNGKRLRFGVLGTAHVGRAAVNPAIQASRNATLLAVASRDVERARTFAEASAILRHYGSYEALLDDAEVDAVYIPLPNSLHHDWTIRAAQHGKHVLCEKPLALSAAECREMHAAAAAHGVKLMEAFMYRFHPRTERIFEAARSGQLGALRFVRSTFTFRLRRQDDIRLDAELGGGALRDVGCYCVNASRTVAGSEPIEVQAWAEWATSGVDARLAGALRFAGGAVARFDCALDVERREFLEVAGTDAYLTADAAFLPGTEPATLVERRGREERRVQTPGADEYRLMVEHFADCVLEDRPPRYGALEAAANMATIEALYRSARGGGRPEPVSS